MEPFWLSPAFLEWPVWRQVGQPQAPGPLERSYAIWEHARKLIEERGADAFCRGDAIANLKRCLELRTRTLESCYRFRAIPLENKPKGHYELLERYGVARPFLVRHLLEVRNAIEHQDAPAPDAARCRELLDVVWYYLKSTDAMTREVGTEFLFQGKEPWFVECGLDYGLHQKARLWGRVTEAEVSGDPKPGFLMLSGTWRIMEEKRWFSGSLAAVSPAYPRLIRRCLQAC